MRPRRERTDESKSAEEMDARYARGRTALVRRRERFYGPETVCWAFLALCLLILQFLFVLNGFLRFSAVTCWPLLGPEQTSRGSYQLDAPLGPL